MQRKFKNLVSRSKDFLFPKWSCRRYLLSENLAGVAEVRGIVVELGGCKLNSRGPIHLIRPKTIFCNLDVSSSPDVVCDIQFVPLNSGSAELVVCTEVLEYVFDFERVLSESYRILKPGGELALSVPFLHPQHGDYWRDLFRFTDAGLRKALARNGFEIMRIEPMGGAVEVLLDLARHALLTKRSSMHGFGRVGVGVLYMFGYWCWRKYFKKRRSRHRSITTGFFIRAKRPIV